MLFFCCSSHARWHAHQQGRKCKRAGNRRAPTQPKSSTMKLVRGIIAAAYWLHLARPHIFHKWSILMYTPRRIDYAKHANSWCGVWIFAFQTKLAATFCVCMCFFLFCFWHFSLDTCHLDPLLYRSTYLRWNFIYARSFNFPPNAIDTSTDQKPTKVPRKKKKHF